MSGAPSSIRERSFQLLAFAREPRPSANEPTKLAAWQEAQVIAADFQRVAGLPVWKKVGHTSRLLDLVDNFFAKYGL